MDNLRIVKVTFEEENQEKSRIFIQEITRKFLLDQLDTDLDIKAMLLNAKNKNN